MKTSIFYSLLVCFVFACAQGNAQTMTKVYSGDKSPADAGWTELKLDKTISPATTAETSQALTSGILQLRSTNDADQFSQLGWYKTDLQLNLQTGYTIEVKAKVTDASKYGAFNIQGFDNRGKGFRLGIYKNSVVESTNPLAATNVLKSGLTNDDDYHIYRIAVAPDRTAVVYRDGEEIGTFTVSEFYYDNIIENGGFEDGGNDFNNADFFPDFRTNALMYRTDEPDMDNDQKRDAGFVEVDFVRTGKYSLLMDNQGRNETNNPEDYDPNSEQAKTRDLPVKKETRYDISFSRTRISEKNVELDRYWDWRDNGVFYDYQLGTLTGIDERGDNALSDFPGANDNWWQTHNQSIITPSADAAKSANSIRFEFPSWYREGGGVISAYDDIYVKENLGLEMGSEYPGMVGPSFPDSYVNLIANGDFEDWTMNNDGSYYEWALSDPDNSRSNFPVAYNPLWGVDLRIQRNDKSDERNKQWAHSGQSALRFSTICDGQGEGPDYGDSNKSFAFTKELEANKSYRFNFWHRNPQYGEQAWLKVKIGEKDIWGHRLFDWHQEWTNVDLTFTTTDENKTLCLYIEPFRDCWYNIYFDDLVLYEIPNLEDPLLAGKTNLIANGDFEDDMLGNDGKPYIWLLASDFTGNDDNYPVKWNDMWGTYVRLQDKTKKSDDPFGDQDTGIQWAHSGNNSLRMSFLDNEGAAIDFGEPDAYRTNMNFVKELEPNKNYTFVFWIKGANYRDVGDLMIANGDIIIWKDQLNTKYISWSRQSVSFTTTEENHTLRMFTEWTGWCNFYLDDLFLYETETPTPLPAENTYLFFGKSMGTQSTNVDVEYVAVDNTGAYGPTGIKPIIVKSANLKTWSSNGSLLFTALNPATVNVYTVAGLQVAQLKINKEASIALPKGVYIVKSVSAGIPETIKVINK